MKRTPLKKKTRLKSKTQLKAKTPLKAKTSLRAKTPMKRRKSTPYALMKKKAWSVFSLYIRLKYADKDGYVTCVTCGKKMKWNEAQAGHAIGGRTNSILFHEELVYPQCAGCNIFKAGNYGEYILFLIDKLGRDRVDELRKLSRETKTVTLEEVTNIHLYYTKKVDELADKIKNFKV